MDVPWRAATVGGINPMPVPADPKGRRVGPIVRAVLRRAGEELLRWTASHALDAAALGVVAALGLHGPPWLR